MLQTKFTKLLSGNLIALTFVIFYVSNAFSYCIPDPNDMHCPFNGAIENVRIAGLDHHGPGCDETSDGYSDFTDEVVELQRGNTYSAIVEFSDGDFSAAMWIDWDGSDSLHSDHLMWRSESADFDENNPAVFEFTVPSNAVLDSTRIRIGGLLFDPIDSANVCGDPPAFFFEGEYEDYTAHIVESTPTPYYHDTSYVFNASDDLAVQGFKEEVIGINIQVLGNEPPVLDLEEFFLNTHITSHDSIINEAEIIYTEGNPHYDPDGISYGSFADPDDDFAVSGTQNLTTGNNFFWVAYNLHDGIGKDHEISAEIDSFVINGNTYEPDPASTPETRNVVQPMEGTYTIGPSAEADFPTISDAEDSLSNNLISGTVHFEIEPGTYAEEVSIGSVEGANSEDTVVFDGLNADSVTVSSSSETFTIFGDHITLQNMTIETTDDETFGPAIRIWDQDSVNILHNKIVKPYGTNTSNFIIRAEGNYLNIGHNHFDGGGIAVQFEEGSHQHFYHNLVTNAGYGGVYYNFNDVNEYPAIWNNEIYADPDGAGTGRGVYVRNVHTDFVIKNNIIVSPGDGIYIYETTNPTAERSLIANNFIINGLESTSGLRGGIRLNEAENIDIVFNSFNTLSERAINSRDGNVSGLALFNNSFKGAQYAVYIDEFTALDTSNFNNFDGSIYVGISYNDLNDWQSGSPYDGSSLEGDPGYMDTTDLRIETSHLYQQGTTFGNIETDIFGTDRPANEPSIGAFEHKAIDLELAELYLPDTDTSCGREQEAVEVILENQGGDAVTDFDIYAHISGDLIDTLSVHYNDTLNGFGGRDTVTLGNFNSNEGSDFDFLAYHNLDDDQNRNNDTIEASRVFGITPEAPVTVNDTSCGEPGVVELVASSPNSEIVWYSLQTGGIELHRGDTFETPELSSSSTFYVIAEHETSGCHSAGGRQAVHAVSLSLPETELLQGSQFTGIMNDGTEADPDQGCAENMLEYQIDEPAGYDNADYNTTWTVTNWSIIDGSGNNADSSFFEAPSASQNGVIGLNPVAAETGITFRIAIEKQDLGTGCIDTTERFVTIRGMPETQFNAQEQICMNDELSVENLSTIPDDQEVSYTIHFGDGNSITSDTQETVTHSYAAAGSYEVLLEATSEAGCTDSYTDSVHVGEIVEAEINTAESIRCAGDTFRFENETVAGDEAVTYEWHFGDGNTSSATDPAHAYDSAGTYNVILQASTDAGCSDSDTLTVEVAAHPEEPIFSTEGQCLDDTILFIPDNTYETYDWDFGDGNTAGVANPEHVYEEAGTYNVTLSVSNQEGCENHYSDDVEIAPMPLSGFTFDVEGSEVTFTPDEEVYDSYHWDFGDGNTSDQVSPVHDYDEPDIYEVNLEATSEAGCVSDSTRMVEVIVNILTSNEAAGTELNVYPNPTEGNFNVRFELPVATSVDLRLLDASGREVEVLVSENYNAGSHAVEIQGNAMNLGTGVYFIQLQSAEGVITKAIRFVE